MFIPFIPHLIAILAWQCNRDAFPFSGFLPEFDSWTHFSDYVATLQNTGTIHLYWYIRPNNSFGTVEFRMCDGSGGTCRLL
ncbi:MAG: hypothetical protein QRY74_01110 [Chlamydia sp.]